MSAAGSFSWLIRSHSRILGLPGFKLGGNMRPTNRLSPEIDLLYLDGKEMGFLKSSEGGAVSAEVITEPVAAAQYAKKHISSPRFEEFILEFGLSMSHPIYDWIAA